MGIPHSDGYTLIEALVALCVLTIASLGAAELQWRSLLTMHQAALQSDALRLASDIAERLRGLPQPEMLFLDSQSSLPEAGRDCALRSCSAAELALADVRESLELRRARLPQARIRICADGAPWDASRKGFRWDCSGAGPVLIKLGWRENAAAPDTPRLVLTVGGVDR
jgi:type IV pilus assembly protein PilV